MNSLDTNGIFIPDKETVFILSYFIKVAFIIIIYMSLLSIFKWIRDYIIITSKVERSCFFSFYSFYRIVKAHMKKWKIRNQNFFRCFPFWREIFPPLLGFFFLFFLFYRDQTLLLQILYKDDLIEYDQILTTIEQHDESLYFEIKNPCYVDIHIILS